MNIRKSAEPKEWTKYKNIPGVQFSGIPALQESLYREQGYLCAYCERRIPVRDKMSTEDHRIEHCIVVINILMKFSAMEIC